MKWVFRAVLISALVATLGAYGVAKNADTRYRVQLSTVVYDRTHTPLKVTTNSRGHYTLPLSSLPDTFAEMLVQKEDRFFYLHPGVNPVSLLRAVFHSVLGRDFGGASTITQQLAKNLLGTESERTLKNKIIEVFYAVSLELFHTKKTILLMYAHTVFLGNQIQGFETGSYAYFNKPLKETTINEQLALLATLSHPSTRNPWEVANSEYAKKLHSALGQDTTFVPAPSTHTYRLQATSTFELDSAHILCTESCTTSIDARVTEDIRAIAKRHIDSGYERGARNAAVVIIDPKNSELIALVGSPDPEEDRDGHKINMAIAPRPIGSVIKPLLYLKGFMEGLRPYTLVEDREYKFPIGTGFSLYPKNYDGQYRGTVTLHEALSNSLNVPSVQVLAFIGLNSFYAFLDEILRFEPIQSYDSYQYGIALGGLEMDLLTLTHYFTLFPREGTLAPLKTLRSTSLQPSLPSQSHIDKELVVAQPEYVALVHAILSDRLTGINQFGLTSTLNLTTKEYGVKTGTSRDFHDSWVVGYTKDFVVGVWMGNSENTALAQVSGQSGAGAIWHDVMEYLLSSPYNTNTPFTYDGIQRIPLGNSLEWGLPDDDREKAIHLLQNDSLITSIHTGDTFAFAPRLTIPLRATKEVTWTIQGEPHGTSKETHFSPPSPGSYEITAFDAESQKTERISIDVVSTQ